MKMEHIDFHISYRCVNKCIFCSSAGSIKKFKNHILNLEEIIKILKEKRKKGFKSVNFTGGEPTLHPQFVNLVKKAKELGYRIYVGTNGKMFENKDFCRKSAPFLDEICFSIHGHKAAYIIFIPKIKKVLKD